MPVIKDFKEHRNIKTSGYVIVLITFLIVANLILGVVLIRESGGALISLISSRMLDISNTAADMLDGDALERLTADDVDSEDYRKVMDTLGVFRDNINLRYIYCIKEASEGNFVFSVDPTIEDPGEFGEPVVSTEALVKASKGTAAVDDEPYEDAWGRFYSSYSPVFNSKGEVAGIVAVDFSADWYDAQIRNQTLSMAGIGLFSLVAGAVVSFLLLSKVRRKYNELYSQLTGLADNIGELVKEAESIDGENVVFNDEEARKNETGVYEIDDLSDKIESIQGHIDEHIEILREQALIDKLTGVANKNAYLIDVEKLEEEITRGTADFAVGVFDLNSLKYMNDNYGHAAGDLALTDTSTILIDAFGKDNIYRIGGDEFTCILKNISQEDLKTAVTKMDADIEVLHKEEKPYIIPLSVSKGFGIYTPGQDKSFTEVFKRADEIMYKDKSEYYSKNGDRRRKR